jgi:tetratricopeptide (TPR) repeat protein
MKKFFIGVGIIASTLLVENVGLAQSKMVQDAYSKYKLVTPKNDAEKNLRILEEAKNFIDAAATNPETKEDPKMHFYRAQIYMSLYETSAQQAMASGNIDQAKLEGYKTSAAYSFLFCLNEPKKKYKNDVQAMIDMKYTLFFEMGVKSYNEKKYDQAMLMFFQAYDIKNMVNMDAGEAKNNAIISLNQVVDTLTKGEKPDFKTAITLVEQVRTQFPKDIDLIITLINIHLKNNDMPSAEKCMSEAVVLDPNNKVLHYNLGTSYMNQGLNERAEQSLMKALEIDPSYKDAQYQLGAHLYNWANQVNQEAGELNANDPKVAELEQKSEDLLKKSLSVLEKYIESNPTDKDVLGILYKTYFKLGNSEKGKEYKTRYDAQK